MYISFKCNGKYSLYNVINMRVIALLFLFPALLSAQNKHYEKIEKYLDKQVEINKFGGTVLIAKNDSVILKKAYGKANMEFDVNNTVDTKFVLASISKYFTALAVMQLVERDKLSLDSKLSDFYPKYPKGDQVTVHMLLTHTAGLPLDFEDLYMDFTNITKDSAIVTLQSKPYLFEPGTNLKYSNIGYFLLSQIIEKASGDSYADFLQQNIFDKIGMQNTGVSNNDSIISKKATIYYRNGNSYALNPYINWNLNTGLDGIYSTVEDLYKLDRALYSDKLISTKTKALMHTKYNAKYPDGNFFDSYGYGIFIDPYYNHGHHLLTHSGGFVGTMTTFDRYPDDNTFIVVLSNNESESHMISYGLAGILFNKSVEIPYQHIPFKINPRLLKDYVGTFDGFKILLENDKLYLNNLETELIPESETKFFRKDNPDRTFKFLASKNRKYDSVEITKGGVVELKKRRKDSPKR